MKTTVIAITIGSLLVAHEASASWAIETIASTGDVGSNNSIAWQSGIGNGKVHIVYEAFDGTAFHVFYTSKWINNGSFPPPVQIADGRKPQIAVVGTTPYISWASTLNNNSIQYAAWVGSGGNCGGGAWACEQVESNVGGLRESAVLPSTVAYRDDSVVVRADKSGMVWSSFALLGSSSDHPSMARYANGAAATGFSSGSTAYYFQGFPQAYYLENVGSAANTILYTDINIDGADTVRMIYNDQFRKRNGSWIGSTFTSQPVPNRASLVTLNAAHNPAVFYGNSTGLHEAYSPGIGWTQHDVDTSVSVGPVDAAAVGLSANSVVVYYDVTHQDLRFAFGAF